MTASTFRILAIGFFLLHFQMVVVFADEARERVDSVNAAYSYQYIVSNLKKSVGSLGKNVDLARGIGYRYGEAVALDKLSLAHTLSGDHDESFETLLLAVRIFEELDAIAELSMAYGNYGYHCKRRDMAVANKYVKMGVRIAEAHQLDINLATLYDHYGVVKFLENQRDSALHFYQKSLDLKYELGDSLGIPYGLNKMAEMYAQQGDFEKAFANLRESDAIRAREEGEYGRTENLVHYGDVFRTKGDHALAIYYYTRAIEKGKQIDFPYLVQYSYEHLTTLYEQSDDPSAALENYRQFVAYKDSLLNLKTNEKIAELQIAFETENKDRLLAQNELEIQTKSQQLALAIVALIAVLGSLILGYRYYQRRQERIRRELEIKNRIEKAELQQKMSDEKLRISRELHDNIGSNLTVIINSIDGLEHVADQGLLHDRLSRVGAYCRETIAELRNSIWAIKQEKGDLQQLVLKFNELKRTINSSMAKPEITVSADTQLAGDLTSGQMLNLYRFVQEAVQNAVKYAAAEKVEINVSSHSSEIIVTIRDNGCGFDQNQPSTGYGLANMKSRCSDAGGQFEVNSSPAGTSVSCTIKQK